MRGSSPSIISVFATRARGRVYIFLQAQRSFFSRDIIVTRDGTKDRTAGGERTHTRTYTHARGEGRKVIRISLHFPDSCGAPRGKRTRFTCADAQEAVDTSSSQSRVYIERGTMTAALMQRKRVTL